MTFKQILYTTLLATTLACTDSPAPKPVEHSPASTAQDIESPQIPTSQNFNRPQVSIDTLIQQDFYISPEKTYALPTDPNKFGLELTTQEIKENGNYADSYQSEDAMILIRRLRDNHDLETSYTATSVQMSKMYGDGLTTLLNPGTGIQWLGEGEPTTLEIDQMPALRGGLDYWLYTSPIEDVLQGKTDYDAKYTLHVALAQQNNQSYAFVLFYQHTTPKNDQNVEKLYAQVLTGFKAIQ